MTISTTDTTKPFNEKTYQTLIEFRDCFEIPEGKAKSDEGRWN